MHVHAHGHRAKTVLTLSALATLGYVVLAFLAGMRAHSLALVSEAGHNLTDFLALGFTWLGVYFQSRPATSSKTFGYHRAGVLSALVNVATLGAITVMIVVEAVGRLRAPQPVATGPMLWVASVGVIMNVVIAGALESGRHDVNLRAAFLHMVGDAVATGMVIVGALVIARTGMLIVDPLLSLAIAALILMSGWDVLRETLNILLEGAPRGIRSEQVSADMAAVAGVRAVHDLHIWSLGSQSHALSAHVQIADIPPSESDGILCGIRQMLAERYRIRHATIQFENIACDLSSGCRMVGHEGR